MQIYLGPVTQYRGLAKGRISKNQRWRLVKEQRDAAALFLTFRSFWPFSPTLLSRDKVSPLIDWVDGQGGHEMDAVLTGELRILWIYSQLATNRASNGPFTRDGALAQKWQDGER